MLENWWTILVALATIPLATFIVFSLFFASKKTIQKKTPAIFFVGPTESGKTTLFCQLVYEKTKSTVPSIEPNEALWKDDIVLVDLPGHARTKHWTEKKLNESYDIRLVVFVLNSATMDRDLHQIGLSLFDVLLKCRKHKISKVLVACNKFDLFTAQPAKQIQTAVLKELDNIFEEKEAQLDAIVTEDVDWDQLRPQLQDIPLEFLSGSALKGTNLDQWIQWMESSL
ncbi:signal recognition particle receptor beta subunit Srp102 [Schizosaccharomyces cryophilus OY26]|uniref:Signal recognition particle receptor subunit beta n=1 Tax=Schizosaccharomyces cryophilus (strain OY26 / ATCC MYA-4695 / CBS 11777 / NBRC 106824 / NRRL Y48691) TaxID=653667 RepID=S9XBA0_SCHCR|nr:signal recognition particle receptor beta subunit Srp102 [Schizosaccharomyces cryophilus OY26]EPY51021.1 signal recognition particle receptor beta subunit Srp102 [Schizosaccharomyces cryophilus OY26]